MSIEFRRATAQDAEEFYGRPPLASFRGYAAVEDGKVIGVGGVYYDEFRRPVVFSEMKPEMEKHTKAKAKAVRMLVKFAEEKHRILFAVADARYPTSGYLLAKLGFKPTGEMTTMGELLRKEIR